MYFLPITPTFLKMWLIAFVITQLLEMPLYWCKLQDLPYTRWQRIGIAYGASALTHPFVWFATPWYAPCPYPVLFVGAETFAIVVEGYYLSRWGCSRPWLWAFLTNAFSSGVGQIISWLWPHWFQ